MLFVRLYLPQPRLECSGARRKCWLSLDDEQTSRQPKKYICGVHTRRLELVAMFSSDRETVDIGSMASALRLHPDDFAMQGQCVLHLPTGLQFTFRPTHRATPLNFLKPQPTRLLSFNPKNQPDLYRAFEQWRSSYWQIIECNERTDSPFVPRGWKRVRRMITTVLRRFGDTPDLPIIPGA